MRGKRGGSKKGGPYFRGREQAVEARGLNAEAGNVKGKPAHSSVVSRRGNAGRGAARNLVKAPGGHSGTGSTFLRGGRLSLC